MESSSSQSALKQHRKRPLLSDTLPPLIFGTATLNYQFNVDPYALNPNTLVSEAIHAGIRAFDTSPYYGPAEEILGAALHSPLITHSATLSPPLQRSDYFLLTKAGRIANNTFDYSPAWIRHSVHRSLRRLHTHYLDVVYLHDVEFVSAAEVLAAVTELRRLRDEEHIVNHIGICGYPVDVLCGLAELVLRETHEPLDIVQSYANCTLQNCRLLMHGLARLVAAGVDVVPNASPLGMGLLRQQGPPVGAMGNWHPAPDGLRAACASAARWVAAAQAERLEIVAVRFAMETWIRDGAAVGVRGPIPSDVVAGTAANATDGGGAAERRGVSVMGVSTLAELEETIRVYGSVIDGIADTKADVAVVENDQALTPAPQDALSDREWPLQRRQRVRQLATMIRTELIGKEWADFAWNSPEPGFVNQRKVFGVDPAERDEADGAVDETRKVDVRSGSSAVGGSEPHEARILPLPADEQ